MGPKDENLGGHCRKGNVPVELVVNYELVIGSFVLNSDFDLRYAGWEITDRALPKLVDLCSRRPLSRVGF
jgi:hypothetical protein